MSKGFPNIADECKSISLDDIFSLYYERMALFSYSGKEASILHRKYVAQNEIEVNKIIKEILAGKYTLNYLLGLMPPQRKTAVIAMATYIAAAGKHDWDYINSIIDATIADHKKDRLACVEPNAVTWILNETIKRNEPIFAAYAFSNSYVNTPTRAFYLPVLICKNHILDSENRDQALTSAYFALCLNQQILNCTFTNNETLKRYLFTVASKDVFKGNTLGQIYLEDEKEYAAGPQRKSASEHLDTFDGRMQVSFGVILNMMLSTGLLQKSGMDAISFSKAKQEDLCGRAMVACDLNDSDFNYDAIAELYLNGRADECSEEDRKIFDTAVQEFKIALHYIIYISSILELYKKTVFDSLNNQIFNPTEKSIASKLNSTQRIVEQQKEKLSAAKRSMREIREENTTLSSQLREVRNKNVGLQGKIDSQQKEIEALKEELQRLKNLIPPQHEETETLPKEDTETPQNEAVEEPNYRKELTNIFSTHKIAFVGGNINIMQKFAAAYPAAVVIPKERVTNADSLIENADAVLFKPDSIGHKEVYKTKSIISRKQIPFSYIGDIANLKLLEKNVYEELKKLGF